MSTVDRPATTMGSLVLHDISPDQYRGLIEAMSEHRFRHTYSHRTLEVFGETIVGSAATRPNATRPPVTKEDERVITLYDIDTRQYRGILEAMGNHRFRHSYLHGTLKIMSPSQTHEWEKRFLEMLFPFMAIELGIEILSLGSWTMRPEDDAAGLEPDSCFYIANEPKVRFNPNIDLDKDPPPDLAIEIDVSYSTESRLAIYEVLRVPEIWRYAGDRMIFLRLTADGYAEVDRSVAFPFLPPSKLEELLNARGKKTELELVKEFVAWVRDVAVE